MHAEKEWSASRYDQSFAFVSYFGESMLDWLEPQVQEIIIDLGCGSGDLTLKLVESGAQVIGIDASESMLAIAGSKVPEAQFLHQDGHSFSVEQEVDAVFSNAALHWMTRPAEVIASIHRALKPGGRFAAEFGGKGNIAPLVEAVHQSFIAQGYSDRHSSMPWYFPAIGEYSSMLERQGLEVMKAQMIDRPTVLSDGEEGIKSWLRMFAGAYFEGLSQGAIRSLYEEIEQRLRPDYYDAQQKCWSLPYRRIRVMAIKTDV